MWWNKIVKLIKVCFSESMLSLHLVGKRHLLVYLGTSLGTGELGD